MSGHIHRVTMFKIPDPANQKKLLAAYETLGKNQQKDGKPYILSMRAGPAKEDARSKGFTVVGQTEFASMDDMKYYDTDCGAHAELKGLAKGLGIEGGPDGVMTVYFEAEVSM